jgi:predicted HAD superfamily Cof-like phosphohydrolase
MRVEQEKVQLFMEKHEYDVATTPRLVPFDMAVHRHKLMLEELGEYYDAVTSGDLVEVADALADLAYVLLGTAVVHGINLQAVFDEVHRSNMTKAPLDPVTRKGGKGLDYEPPAIAAVLLREYFDGA